MAEVFAVEGQRIQGDILFREADHAYIHMPTGKKLASVSEVIKCVYSPKSWDGVDPAVVENARVRGSTVDRYMTQYVRDQRLTITNELYDVTERVIAAHRIWEERFHGLPVEAQMIVYSLEDGIAGTMDFWVDRRTVVDLKSTYSPEAAWVLQIGAYTTYAPEIAESAGVIHVNPKVYRSGGIWIDYDVAKCMAYWRHAVEWWKESKFMAQAAMKK